MFYGCRQDIFLFLHHTSVGIPHGKGAEMANRQLKDSSSKLIFGDNILCSQFLRDYGDMDILRKIRPEDLEDVTSRYSHLFSGERNSDVVKKVDIGKYMSINKDENPLGLQPYIVSLIEHKTKVEYNVAMQILRYMIYIWEDYEKEMEKKCLHISARKDFRYPPVFPIVYYEGTSNWTASCDLSDRIFCKELLKDYLPHFKYQMVRLHDYSNEMLLGKGDEISLAMMINKIRCPEDMEAFARLPDEQVDEILKNTPEYLLSLMGEVMRALFSSMNLEEEKTENVVSKIKERKMGRLFEGVTFDFQAARKEFEETATKAKEEAEAAKMKAEIARKEMETARKEMETARKEMETARKETETAKEEVKTVKTEAEIARHIAKMLINGFSGDEIKKSLQQEFALSEERAEKEYEKVTG